MAGLLASETHGSYAVLALKNETHSNIRQEIYATLHKAQSDDVVLIYYSGHGKVDDAGNLYLVSRDTSLEYLPTSAVLIDDIKRFIRMSKANRVILILDCCYSGAVGNDLGRRGDIQSQTHQILPSNLQGRGTFILTACTDVQTAREREGDTYGLLTKHIISGIGDGSADRDDDGRVSMQELLTYVQEKVSAEGVQEPRGWALNMNGDIYVAETGRLAKGRRRALVLETLYQKGLQYKIPANVARLMFAAIEDNTELSPETRRRLDQTVERLSRTAASDDFVESAIHEATLIQPILPLVEAALLQQLRLDHDRMSKSLDAERGKAAELQALADQLQEGLKAADEQRTKEVEETRREVGVVVEARNSTAKKVKQFSDEIAKLQKKLQRSTALLESSRNKALEDKVVIEGLNEAAKVLEQEKSDLSTRLEAERKGRVKAEEAQKRLRAGSEKIKQPEVQQVQTASYIPTVRERVREILKGFGGTPDYYVDPNIPSNKLANARKVCGLTPLDMVIALIDCTVFGSATDCVVFTGDTLYYRNFVGKSGSVPYIKLNESSAGEVNLAGSSFPKSKLPELLAMIKRTVPAK